MSEIQWLKEGEKTKITPYIKQICNSIQGNDLKFIENLSKFVGSLNSKNWPSPNNLPDFRLSSAEELLKRKVLYGCIEIGTVFRTLCIAKGIPAIFVETLKESWLNSEINSKNPYLIEGHVFIDVFIEGKWHTINPVNKDWLHTYGDYSLQLSKLEKYVVIGKGLDSFDLGFMNMLEFRKIIAKKFNKKEILY